MKKLVTMLVPVVVILTGGYLGLDYLAPGWTAELRGIVSEHGGVWSETAMQRDPVGFLEYTRKRLMSEKENLGKVVLDIRENLAPLDQHIQERTEDLVRTNAFLKEGREVYQTAVETAKTRDIDAIKFAGRTYPDLVTFKSQLQLLYNEKQSNNGLVAQGQETRTRLRERLYSMLLHQGKLEMAIQEIGPQIAIVKAEVSVQQLDAIMERTQSVTDGVLKKSAEMVDEYGPIGTTRDLVESSKQAVFEDSAVNSEFEQFLTGQASS